jgi:NADPH-dependent 2,4-dienoyl-CoA reductase/sulfur reductase-like enzyme
VTVHSATAVTGIENVGAQLRVHCGNGLSAQGDLVIVAAGVTPSSELARNAGIPLGPNGAIRVNRRMETERANVFAAGDCAETWHRILQRNSYLPLGSTSHKQGRVAGENAVGGDRRFEGTLGTQIVKVFDLAIGRTGLRESEAANAGFSPMSSSATGFDHKAYYPGAKEVTTRITGDALTGRLLGAQMVGHWQASIAKRIDVFATALFNGMTIDGLSDLDLSYTPPLGSPWDVVQSAAQSWSAAQRSILKREQVNA